MPFADDQHPVQALAAGAGDPPFRDRVRLRGLRAGSSRLFGLFGRREQPHEARGWHKLEPLIGHARSAVLRGTLARIRGLKPAQIADLLEDCGCRKTYATRRYSWLTPPARSCRRTRK